MKGTSTMNIASNIFVPFILGLICAGIVYAALTGKSLPLISTPRAALIALLIVGMAMCAAGGIGQVGVSGHWASPLAIAGYLLGAVILIVIIGGLSGWKLPLVQSETQAVLAVAVLMSVKYVIGTAGFFFHWL